MFPSIIYVCPKRQALSLSKDSDGLTFRKEFAPIGNYEKGDLRFSIDEDLIDHWVRTFDEMQYDGIPVPMPIQHTEDPEKRRATVLRLEKALNEEGKKSLFGVYKFRDEQAARDLKDADVSIFVPLEFKNGVGKKYSYPIRHVAFTDYPVLPKLGKAQAIACSYVEEREKPMSAGSEKKPEEEKKPGEEKKPEGGNSGFLRRIAAKLGLPDDLPEDQLEDGIEYVVDDIMNEEEEEEEPGNPGERKEGMPEKGALHRETKEYHPPIAAGFISMAMDSRKTKLENLVREHKITPAVRDKIEKEYCTEECLQLALSMDGNSSDGFDELVSMFAANEPILKPEQSGNQEMELSYDQVLASASKNPLIADAERRQKA